MAHDVPGSYDSMAEIYASLVLSELDSDAYLRDGFAAFAEVAAQQTGPVADLGCGPGHITDHLSRLGLTVIGYDLSSGQIAQGRQAFPDLDLHVGDLTALNHDDSSLGGIVARHSLIHMLPSAFDDVFAEWVRVLEPAAPLFVSFFGASSVQAHGTPFDHKVVTAYELFPATVAQQLSEAGFTDVEVDVRPPPEVGRQLDQAVVLARKPAS